MSDKYKTLRLIWGALLFAAGIAMFFTIPEKIKEFQDKGRYFFGLNYMLYLISILLMIGGGKKIFLHLKQHSITEANNSDKL